MFRCKFDADTFSATDNLAIRVEGNLYAVVGFATGTLFQEAPQQKTPRRSVQPCVIESGEVVAFATLGYDPCIVQPPFAVTEDQWRAIQNGFDIESPTGRHCEIRDDLPTIQTPEVEVVKNKILIALSKNYAGLSLEAITDACGEPGDSQVFVSAIDNLLDDVRVYALTNRKGDEVIGYQIIL